MKESRTLNLFCVTKTKNFGGLYVGVPIIERIMILVEWIFKNDFCDLLNLTIKESFFTFNNKFYIQVDGVAMGFPLGPILANIFLLHL